MQRSRRQLYTVYDSTARRHCGLKAVCNYDSQVDADEAIREASEIAVLINDGCMSLIA
jgi:hypothetical protein